MTPFEWTDPQETLRAAPARRGPRRDAMRRIRLFADLWTRIQDLPRHLGQHSGGMVICQGRLDEVVPLEPAAMPGRVVIQWDKDDCADMGIVKVDLLGLGMMAVLQDALTIINGRQRRRRRGRRPDRRRLTSRPREQPCRRRPIDLAHLPPDDPVVYRMLQEADTIGVFQVESRAQMATLPRLKPAHFYDLVVEVAIIRPGPDRRADGASLPGAAGGPRAGGLCAPAAAADPRAHARRAALPGAVAAHGDGRGGVHGRRSRGAAPRDGVQAVRGAHAGDRDEAARRHGAQRHHRRDGRRDRALDHLVCAVRLPRVARGELRAAGLRERVPEGALPGGVLRGAAEQPAHGVLPPGDASSRTRSGTACGSRPIDVQASDWLCRVEPDGAIRLGLCFVRGLREETGRSTAEREPRRGRAAPGRPGPRSTSSRRRACPNRRPVPKCGVPTTRRCSSGSVGRFQRDSPMVLQRVRAPVDRATRRLRRGARGDRAVAPAASGQDRPLPAASCSVPVDGLRFDSLDRFVALDRRARDELAVLAEIGALQSFGYDRRGALWQIERAARPAGELFEQHRRAPAAVPAAADDAGRAGRGRLRRHEPDDRPASHGAAPRRTVAAWRAAGDGSRRRPGPGAACAWPAPSSRVSARARPRALRSSRSRTKPAFRTSSSGPTSSTGTAGHRGRAVPADRGGAAAAGRRHLDPGRPPAVHRGRTGRAGVARLPLDQEFTCVHENS